MLFQPRVPAFTVPQPGRSLGVIAGRAQEIGVSLQSVGKKNSIETVAIQVNEDLC